MYNGKRNNGQSFLFIPDIMPGTFTYVIICNPPETWWWRWRQLHFANEVQRDYVTPPVSHCDDHGGVLVTSPFKGTYCQEGSWWTSSSCHSFESTAAFITEPLSPRGAPTQWLRMIPQRKKERQRWGHPSPKQTLLTGNLCSGDPHCLAEIFLRDALKSEALLTHSSFLLDLLS